VSLARGRQAEDDALALLVKSGLRLVERNYRCRMGEIDLVMTDGPVLVFVEVRSRARTRFPSACESIGPRKQTRLTAAARHFVASHPQVAERPMRFDVVAISASGTDNETRWIRAAFDAAGTG
jgi:putative endonuclease